MGAARCRRAGPGGGRAAGHPGPSRADEAITRRINEAANLMQLKFLDHVIVGEPSPGRSPYFSFREAGLVS